MRTAPFRYKLAPLLRRDEWERDTLGAELRRAHIVFEQAQRGHASALVLVNVAEQRMREIHTRDRAIELEGRRLLHVYLGQAHGTAALRRAELDRARALLDEVLAQFELKRLAVSTFEKHRERQHRSHQVDEGRSLQRAADEAWLTRAGRR